MQSLYDVQHIRLSLAFFYQLLTQWYDNTHIECSRRRRVAKFETLSLSYFYLIYVPSCIKNDIRFQIENVKRTLPLMLRFCNVIIQLARFFLRHNSHFTGAFKPKLFSLAYYSVPFRMFHLVAQMREQPPSHKLRIFRGPTHLCHVSCLCKYEQ